jgi:hypothetical protein
MRANLARSGIAIAAVVLAICVSGCWVAALQLAPVALEAAEDTSIAVLSLVETEKIPSAGAIELRKGADGTTEYRDLRIDVSFDEPQWVAVVDENNADADGWRPALNLPRMSFDPPMEGIPPESGTSYLTYLAAESDSPSAQGRYLAFTKCFGAPVGRFTYEGRDYSYSLPRTLSCMN